MSHREQYFHTARFCSKFKVWSNKYLLSMKDFQIRTKLRKLQWEAMSHVNEKV